MRNKARNTRSPQYLDEIPEGCVIDGSHQHPDDFAVAVIRYAEKLGMEIEDRDLVHILLRENEMQDYLTDEMRGESSATLSEVSDEAVNWLNDHVAQENYAFLIEESDLFLEVMADEDSLDD